MKTYIKPTCHPAYHYLTDKRLISVIRVIKASKKEGQKPGKQWIYFTNQLNKLWELSI